MLDLLLTSLIALNGVEVWEKSRISASFCGFHLEERAATTQSFSQHYCLHVRKLACCKQMYKKGMSLVVCVGALGGKSPALCSKSLFSEERVGPVGSELRVDPRWLPPYMELERRRIHLLMALVCVGFDQLVKFSRCWALHDFACFKPMKSFNQSMKIAFLIFLFLECSIAKLALKVWAS